MTRATNKSAGRFAKQRPRKRDESESPNPTDIYNELLAEAASSSPTQEPERPLKKRKIWKPSKSEVAASSPALSHSAFERALEKQAAIQTVFTETEQSDEDDFEWEDITLEQENIVPANNAEARLTSEGITLSLEDDKPRKLKFGKRALGPNLDKSERIQAHKTHFLTLIMHAYIRNMWCNDHRVQETVKRLVPSQVRSSLAPDPGTSQFNKDRFFKQGLGDLKDIWKLNFNPTQQGIRQPSWLSYLQPKRFCLPPDTERLVDMKDFRDAAKSFEGSQDTGVQLLCAALRALDVETRLVCSLQPLSFVQFQRDIRAGSDGKFEQLNDNLSDTANSDNENSTAAQLDVATSESPMRRRRLGQPSLDPALPRPPPQRVRKRKYVTRFPVYWVEAFNAALQKWTPVEPFSTDTVGKPSKLEPPVSQSNRGARMVYVIAFEEDGVAKDVTKRYASTYNAKTRRERIESVEGGEMWFKKAMRIFRRRSGVTTDRDQIEVVELAKNEAQEGMPRAIQDFKDHPVYALERHLKRNEVIHPKREVGKVGATGKATKLEPVYRRGDVKVVRSAEKWYRLGREIIAGEQPLKHLARKQDPLDLRDTHMADADADAEEPDIGTPLYASFQTLVYTPPPCMRGHVPKNAFGNIDVYVASMVPAGGKHVRNPEAFRAAKLVGIDYADAVIGFEFKGRRGTAVIEGIVIAEEYAPAVEAVLESMAYAREQSEEDARSTLALRMWKRFLIGLRVVQRVNEYEIEGEKGTFALTTDASEEVENYVVESIDEGGGFLPGEAQDVAMPTARSSRRRLIDESEIEDELGDTSDYRDEFEANKLKGSPKESGDAISVNDNTGDGGGFLVEENGAEGGFLHEDLADSDAGSQSLADYGPDVFRDAIVKPAKLEEDDSMTNAEESSYSPESKLRRIPLQIQKANRSDGSHLGIHDIPEGFSNDSSTDDLETQLALTQSIELQNDESQLLDKSKEQREDSERAPSSVGQCYGSMLQGQGESTNGGNGLPSSDIARISSQSPNAFKELDDQYQVDDVASSDDQGSLLSHDPEDEEAEPEWLAEI